MKTRVFTTCVILFITLISNGQIAFYDATKLKNDKSWYYEKDGIVIFQDEDAYKILAHYTDIDNPDEKKIFEHFKNNPFIRVQDIKGTPQSFSKSIAKIPSQMGSLDVTNFAYGLTDFLIDRTKTELNIAFFNKFKEEMLKDDYNDLKTLFPETAKTLEAIGNEIYYYNNYLQSLRNAFETDLSRMPEQVELWLKGKNPSTNSTIKINKDLYKLLISLIHNSLLIKENQHPGKILNELAINLNKVQFEQNNYKNLQGTIQLISLISESFRNIDPKASQYWVDANSLKELNDSITIKIYLGLLYQSIKNDPSKDITFYGAKTQIKFSDILFNNAQKINDFQKLIYDFASHIEDIDNKVSILVKINQKIKNDTNLTSKERTKTLFNASFDVTNSLISLLKETPVSLKELNITQFSNILSSENMDKISSAIYRIESVQKILVYSINAQYAGAISQTFMFLNDLQLEQNEQWTKFLMYGSFMANIIEADSPEAVTAAIESIAAPPGSYSIKRRVPFSIALNGYLGFFAGGEMIYVDKNTQWAFNPAITAPVGISFNHNSDNCSDILPNVFLSVLDLGFVASYRLSGSDNSVSSTPNIQLSQIISPGLFLEWGTGKNSPITIGLGYQIGSQIRETQSENQILGDVYHRVGITIKADLPILYLKK